MTPERRGGQAASALATPERDVGPLGSRLVFLISQPRSGSTLLQRLLAGHPDVATTSEPWFMLPLLYWLRRDGTAADYNAVNAAIGLREFLDALPEGRRTQVEAVRAAAATMYGAALSSTGRRRFLDKTPRYYLVVPELAEVFPEASFLFLVRNPVDVFASILETHAGGDWTGLARPDRFHDLVTAPRAILEATARSDLRAAVVRYEDLARDPEAAMRRVARGLGLAFEPALLRYGGDVAGSGALGDRHTLGRHDRPVTTRVGTWRERFDEPWKRSLADAYLRHLGEATVRALGYDYSALRRDLSPDAAAPAGGDRRWRLISTPPERRTWRDALRLSVARSLRERGAARTVVRAIETAVVGRPSGRRG
jgi:hypothetical protein